MSANNKILYGIQKCEEKIGGLNRYPDMPIIIEFLKRMPDELTI